MSAYIVVDVDIHDPVAYEPYKKMALAAVTHYGGRYIARGGAVEVLEGDWSPKRFVIVEFPGMAQAKAFYDSPEYAEAKAIRHANATSTLFITEGLPTP
jgi:uncharacterized protein (DUF1330 family)